MEIRIGNRESIESRASVEVVATGKSEKAAHIKHADHSWLDGLLARWLASLLASLPARSLTQVD